MIIHGEYIIIFWGKTDDHFWEGFRHQINSQSSEDVAHLMCKPGGKPQVEKVWAQREAITHRIKTNCEIIS